MSGLDTSQQTGGWNKNHQPEGMNNNQYPGTTSNPTGGCQSGVKSISQQMLPPKKRGDWRDDESVEVRTGQGETERRILPGVIRHTSCPHTNLAFYYQVSKDSVGNT